MCKIEIDINYILQDESKRISPIEKVNRIVRVDGQEVYNEMMDWKIYYTSDTHPIRQLEQFLLGFEKAKDTNNTCSKRSQPVGFFKKIWLKFFCKNLNFCT